MSDARGPLDWMAIRSTSPDGMISAVLSGRGEVELSFQPGSYRSYSRKHFVSPRPSVADINTGLKHVRDDYVFYPD